jgi:hypothetical protein
MEAIAPFDPDGVRVAVAPALNFSGSADFDPARVADLMASELSTFEGVAVIGVSRVLAILAEQGVDQILSPEHALDVCERLGADVILVFAVTEYNAYTPVVGLAAQIYGPQASPSDWDPVATSRMARPFPVDRSTDARRPQAQVQQVFNGHHEAVQKQVREYARSRDGHESPFGWRLYLESQQDYLRFCCFSLARELILQRNENQAAAPLTAGELG